MWHFLHLIARPIEVLLGVFCVLTAIVLYPDEEGRIQSKFEDFWIRVDDFKNSALTRHAAFLTQVAKLETQFLNRLFGHKLISSQSIGVSFSLSLLTFSILGLATLGYASKVEDIRSMFLRFYLSLLIVSLLVGVTSIFVRRRQNTRTIAIASAIILVPFFIFKFNPNLDSARAEVSANVLYLAVGGFACDVAFVALTRRFVMWTGEMTSTVKVMGTIVLNVFLALCLTAPLLFSFINALSHRYLSVFFTRWFGILDAIALTNVFDVALALLFVLLATLLLIHRALWPLLTRTLFRMADIGTKGRRAILTAIGISLLGTSVFGEKFPELLKEFVKAFGG
jgi:hypothetical protein